MMIETILKKTEKIYNNLFLLAYIKGVNLEEIVLQSEAGVEEIYDESLFPEGYKCMAILDVVMHEMGSSISELFSMDSTSKYAILENIIAELKEENITDIEEDEDGGMEITYRIGRPNSMCSEGDISTYYRNFFLKTGFESLTYHRCFSTYEISISNYVDLRMKMSYVTEKGNNIIDSDYVYDVVDITDELSQEQYERVEKLLISDSNYNSDDIEEDEEDEECSYVIEYRTFVIKDDNYIKECMRSGHDIEKVTASVNIIKYNGETEEIEIPAYFCMDCGLYFIEESQYNLLLVRGRLLCQILTMSEYRTYNNSGNLSNNWAQQSILKIGGYSVAKNDGLSERQRQTILEYIIESGILSKADVVNYLDFFIRLNEGKKNMSYAVSKWRSDMQYLRNYSNNNGTKRKVGIKSIKE